LSKFGRQSDVEPPQEKRKWLFQRMSFADLERFAGPGVNQTLGSRV
jgi:hypothetical protein